MLDGISDQIGDEGSIQFGRPSLCQDDLRHHPASPISSLVHVQRAFRLSIAQDEEVLQLFQQEQEQYPSHGMQGRIDNDSCLLQAMQCQSMRRPTHRSN
jgi:hypothetical protein